MANKKRSRKALYKSPIFYVVVLVLIAAVVVVILITHKPAKHVTASFYTKGDVPISKSDGTSDVNGNSTNSSSSSAKDTSGSSTTSNTYLQAPAGDFVSDHHPNLSGSPAPNTLTSVCSTTPGATCYITFTQGSTVKSLTKQIADAGGGVYWSNYSLQSVGLTTGTWKVQAIASLNGQTKTTDDAMDLTVDQ